MSDYLNTNSDLLIINPEISNEKVLVEEFFTTFEVGVFDQDGEAGTSIASLEARITGLIFCASRPLPITKISKIVEIDNSTVEAVMLKILQKINSADFGFKLEEVAGGYQFRTKIEIANDIRNLLNTKPKKLSKASAETLAIVAYKQPITKVSIESIRGVDATPTIKTLLDEKLIEILGRENSLGHPSLYGTTEYFLEKFNLKSLLDLPPLREINALAAEPGEPVDSVEPKEKVEKVQNSDSEAGREDYLMNDEFN